jgi:hypothetical protein
MRLQYATAIGKPETLLLGNKLAQILFDKYISFRSAYEQSMSLAQGAYNFHTVL